MVDSRVRYQTMQPQGVEGRAGRGERGRGGGKGGGGERWGGRGGVGELGRQKGVRGLNDSEDKLVVAFVQWLESCPFTKLK